MPTLARPDGVELHWEEAGEGPRVLICNTFNLARMDELVTALAPSRRVLTYEPRGLGRSSGDGPYDLGTGVADLEALLEDRGAVSAALGIGDGAHRAMRVADARPDLVDQVMITSTGIDRGGGPNDSIGFSGSVEVLSALTGLLRRDFRSGLRSMVGGSGGGGDEDVVRRRVEELSAAVTQDAAVGYLEAWIGASSVDVARRLRSRLTILAYEGNSWFPLPLFETMRDHLPDAGYELVDDGPVRRPDLAAEVLLRVTAAATA